VVDLPEERELQSSTSIDAYHWGIGNTPTLYGTSTLAITANSVINSLGVDVTNTLAAHDNIPAPAVMDSEDYLTFDFGIYNRDGDLRLLLEGWFASAASFPGIASGDPIPRLAAQNSSGDWVVIRDVGALEGDGKTIVCDFTGLLPLDGSSNLLRWYVGFWAGHHNVYDYVRLDTNAIVTPTLVAELTATSAVLSDMGLAVLTFATLTAPLNIADQSLPVNPTLQLFGTFTRYGDVSDLLVSVDDEYASFRSGDGILLGFNDASLSPPNDGFNRFYVLKTKVFYVGPAESGGGSAQTQTFPLPLEDMTVYPPVPPYDTTLHAAYLATYQTRTYAA